MGVIRSPTAVLHIDLASLIANYRLIESLVGPEVRVSAVVKSDAYGLGLLPVAQTLHEASVSDFFVADLDEGARLRAELPNATINVLGDDIPGALAEYRRYGLTPVVNSPEDFARIKDEGDGSAYVLNVETGFSRLGLAYDAVRAAYLAGDFDRRRPSLLMTHLACSDIPESPLNERQRHRFAAVRQLLPRTPISLAASAGVWLGPAYHGDAVRIGSALYGFNNPGLRPNPLAPVVRLSAQIIHIADVARKEAVGYAATFRTQRASRIAVLGIGYRQGLPWACAGKIDVRIGAFAAPVVGRVSMEYVNIDVTDIPETLATRGAWVDILHEAFTPDDLAAVLGVNAQEVLTRLGGGACHVYSGQASSRTPAFHGHMRPPEETATPWGSRSPLGDVRSTGMS